MRALTLICCDDATLHRTRKTTEFTSPPCYELVSDIAVNIAPLTADTPSPFHPPGAETHAQCGVRALVAKEGLLTAKTGQVKSCVRAQQQVGVFKVPRSKFTAHHDHLTYAS